jgi:hypothetical protein
MRFESDAAEVYNFPCPPIATVRTKTQYFAEFGRSSTKSNIRFSKHEVLRWAETTRVEGNAK